MSSEEKVEDTPSSDGKKIKIYITISAADGKKIGFHLDSPSDNDGKMTPTVVWNDMKTKVPTCKNVTLVRWVLKRQGETWKGLNTELGPPVHDGDSITFHVFGRLVMPGTKAAA